MSAQIIPPNKDLSSIDKSEIDSLSSRVERLQDSSRFWTSWYLRMVFFAVLVTALTFVAQFLATKRANELANTESLLGGAKARALAEELKDKDLKIGSLKVESEQLILGVAEAKARTKLAEAKIASAEAASKSAVAQVAAADARSAEAQRGAAEASAKAESFRSDIAKANESAEQARAETASAKAEVAKANLEVARLKMPRILGDQDSLTSEMAKYKGTEYTFFGVSPDDDSIMLLRNLDNILQKAGWTRTVSPGFPGLNIYGTDPNNFTVPQAIFDGIRIQVESPDVPVDTSLPLDKLPVRIQTAVSLNLAIFARLSPPEATRFPRVVNILKGESKLIHISIGRKVVAP